MKKILTLSIVLIFTLSLFGLEVDKEEIQTEGQTIEFINYTGTHDTVDTVQQIRSIGTQLGVASTVGVAGSHDRYYVMHIVDPEVTTGFDADILIIGENAKVDHINNIRLIIAGYLQSAYNYSVNDATTIAHFVTIYNAVYRKNIDNFQSKYKRSVTQNLNSDIVGLSQRYDEWPGKTQIVIPLSDPRFAGTTSTVDTSVISEKKVVEKMQEKDDKDIPIREDMIDLKERESKEAEKRAEQAQKQVTETQKKADAEKKQAEEAKELAKAAEAEATKKNEEAKEAQKKAETTQDSTDKKIATEKKQEAEQAKKQAEQAKKEADRLEKKSKETQKEADKKKQDADAEKKLADKKEKEAQDERKNVAADTQRIIEEKAAEKKAQSNAAIASSIPGYGLKVVDEAKLLSELVLLDLKTAKELRTSAINTIHGRCLANANGNLMAIAGTADGGGVIKLVLFDPISLEVIMQGQENISSQSLLIKNENDYYAVVDDNGKYYLGRFDTNLKLQAKSSIQVLAYSPITIVEEGIMVQATDNTIRLIGLKDLISVVK